MFHRGYCLHHASTFVKGPCAFSLCSLQWLGETLTYTGCGNTLLLVELKQKAASLPRCDLLKCPGKLETVIAMCLTVLHFWTGRSYTVRRCRWHSLLDQHANAVQRAKLHRAATNLYPPTHERGIYHRSDTLRQSGGRAAIFLF